MRTYHQNFSIQKSSQISTEFVESLALRWRFASAWDPMAAPATAPWLWVGCGCGDGWAAALRLPPHPGEGKNKDIAKLALAYSDCLSLRGEDITDITPKFVLGDGDSSIHADIQLYLPTGLLSFIDPPCEGCPQAVALEMTEGCRVPLHLSGWEELHKSKRCVKLLIFYNLVKDHERSIVLEQVLV